MELLEGRDTRGFASRHGAQRKKHHVRQLKAEDGEFVITQFKGRAAYKRRAGGYRDSKRCSMCKPGRHHGCGGCKAMKKAGWNASLRSDHWELRRVQQVKGSVQELQGSQDSGWECCLCSTATFNVHNAFAEPLDHDLWECESDDGCDIACARPQQHIPHSSSATSGEFLQELSRCNLIEDDEDTCSTASDLTFVSCLESLAEHNSPRQSMTKWEQALVSAEAVAKQYVGNYQAHVQPSPSKPPKGQTTRARGKVRKVALRRVVNEVDQRICQTFAEFRTHFSHVYGQAVRGALRSCFQGAVELHEAPVATTVQTRFMDVYRLSGCFVPAFHGTSANRHKSIFSEGFLIPGQGNTLSVAHGSAFGLGIYAATPGGIWISKAYCTEGRMLVCAVLAANKGVSKVMDSYVVFDPRCIVPLFEAVAKPCRSTPALLASALRSGGPRASQLEAYASRRAARRRRI